MPEYKIYNQNNMDLLATMEDNSIDAIVTDCPYGLGKEPDALETLQAWITNGYHTITGSGFMGKKWDAFVPQPLFWQEAFRVLKPGGYVLAFFGTRTYDWGTMAIRLAGFEIRDCIQWIYGSGFPKSLDVSKAIDKAAGAEREILSEGKAVKRMIPGADQDKTGSWIKDNGRTFTPTETKAATDDAKTWEGYGTSLKPANEPICVARKPLDGTVAQNVLKHGCGAINLDGCRIETEEKLNIGSNNRSNGAVNFGMKDNKDAQEQNQFGRFPANVIFDEEAAAVLDEQTGVLTSGRPCGIKAGNNNNIYGQYEGGIEVTGYGDSGGASRFFYCAKSSKDDRNYGCEGLAPKDPACVTDFRPSLKSNPENWANGTENAYMRTTPKANNHPTVKPISLMRYLVRLVKTPFNTCTIADFFMGSGTTGIACMLEGINFIGCDEDENSFTISQARIEYAKNDYQKEQAKPKQAELFYEKQTVTPTQLKFL